VPRLLRDLVPVVADADGLVRWVPGVVAVSGPEPPMARVWLAPAALGSALPAVASGADPGSSSDGRHAHRSEAV
jgi:hypothetical protein